MIGEERGEDDDLKEGEERFFFVFVFFGETLEREGEKGEVVRGSARVEQVSGNPHSQGRRGFMPFRAQVRHTADIRQGGRIT